MKLNGIIVALCSVGILNAHAENVAIAKSSLVGDGTAVSITSVGIGREKGR